MKNCNFKRKCCYRLDDDGSKLCAHVGALKQDGTSVKKCPDMKNCKDCTYMKRVKNGIEFKEYGHGVQEIWRCYCNQNILLRNDTLEPFIYRYYVGGGYTPERWDVADTCRMYDGEEQ